jgi:hypothetical protein
MARFLVAHFGLSTTMITQPAKARLVEPQSPVRITGCDDGAPRRRPATLFRRF